MRNESAFEGRRQQIDEFTFELWNANREILASTLRIGEWYSVMYAYLGLAKLQKYLPGIEFSSASGETPFNNRVQEVESAVYGAVDTLGRRAGRDVPDEGPAELRGSRW